MAIISEMNTKEANETREVKSNADGAKGSKQEQKKDKAADQNPDAKQREGRAGPSHQRRPVATSGSLFVTGFAHAINKTHVERLFSKFGTTERISDFMTSQRSTSSSRYCFVEYDSIESAQKAMDNLNGRTLLHKRLVVLPAHGNADDPGKKTAAAPLNPKKERVLIDQKIAALKKKIKESQSD